jgi:Flp pilus assembly protein TadB
MLAAIEWTPILAAATAGLLALSGTVWQSRKTRSLNSLEHGENAAKLERIESKIDRTADEVGKVSSRLDRHLTDHASRRRWGRR